MKLSLRVVCFLTGALTFAAAGCGGGREGGAPDPAASPPPGLAPGRHVAETADRVEMPYVVSGAGESTVVLVHCWMCDRTFWDAQIPVLQDRYRVVALDLPGHGEAGDNRQVWTVEGYGADVAGLLETLDLRHVVLVGHSMGGPVALKAAALARGRVDGIVAVETLHDADFEFDQPMVQQMVAMFDNDFRAACTTMVEQTFVEPGAEALRAEVIRIGCDEANADTGKALIRDFTTLDMPALFREAGVPIRAINAATPNPTRIEANRAYADFDAVLIEDVGHYLQMTRPDEFNAQLLSTLEGLVPAAL